MSWRTRAVPSSTKGSASHKHDSAPVVSTPQRPPRRRSLPDSFREVPSNPMPTAPAPRQRQGSLSGLSLNELREALRSAYRALDVANARQSQLEAEAAQVISCRLHPFLVILNRQKRLAWLSKENAAHCVKRWPPELCSKIGSLTDPLRCDS